MSSCCTISEILQDISRKSPIVNWPTCIWQWHPQWGDPIRPLASENYNPWAIMSAWSCV